MNNKEKHERIYEANHTVVGSRPDGEAAVSKDG
jgi:hypothetical protein